MNLWNCFAFRFILPSTWDYKHAKCACLQYTWRLNGFRSSAANAGDITVVIETKLDVRDGAAWSQFDKAIHKLEGGLEDSGGDVAESMDSDEELPASKSKSGRTILHDWSMDCFMPCYESSYKLQGQLVSIYLVDDEPFD